jgi:transposase
MDWIARTCFPCAIHTADRFHFQKIVTEAVQEMRIAIRREIIDTENKKILDIKAFNKEHEKEIKS